MTGRLTLGYRDAVAPVESVPFEPGQRVSGHEFPHCAVTPPAGAEPAWPWRRSGGSVAGGVHASFLRAPPGRFAGGGAQGSCGPRHGLLLFGNPVPGGRR